MEEIKTIIRQTGNEIDIRIKNKHSEENDAEDGFRFNFKNNKIEIYAKGFYHFIDTEKFFKIIK